MLAFIFIVPYMVFTFLMKSGFYWYHSKLWPVYYYVLNLDTLSFGDA